MANTQTIVRNLTFVLTAVAAVFAVLATGGNYWMIYPGTVPWIDSYKFTHGGLWKQCSFSHCYEIANGSEKLNAVRAFMILACIAFGVGFAYVILLHIKRELDVKLLFLILFVAGFCETIAMSIYTDERGFFNYFDGWYGWYGWYGWSYGWSYALGWISVVLTFVASVLAVISSGDYIKI